MPATPTLHPLRRGANAAFLMLASVVLVGIAALSPAASQTLGASVRLVDGGQRADGRYLAGIEIDLEPGWKTYWRMPGKGGLPPGLDWSRSTNVAEATMLWPAPSRLESVYGDSIGYDRRVVLPVEILPSDPDDDVRLAVSGVIGVCEKICVPLSVDLDASLDAEASPGRLARYLDTVPRTATDAERGAIAATLSPDGTALLVETDLPVVDVFATGTTVANGLSSRTGDTHTIGLTKRHKPESPITLTVLLADDAFDLPLTPMPARRAP